MDFKEAMQHSLKTDKHTHTDPFLLHSRVSDLVGNDYEAKKAAEEFYRLDAKYEISKTLLASVPAQYKKRKKLYYKIKPITQPHDNAYVYFGKDTSILHLSGECPCLKDDPRVYRSTYDHARTLDFKKTYLSKRSSAYITHHRGSVARLSKIHKPRICRRCGSYTPKKATNIFYKLAAWLFDHAYIDIHLKTNHTPTSFELFKTWLGKKMEKTMKIIQSQKKNTTLSEEDVLKLLDENGYLFTSMIQHKFNVGYALAAKIIDTLAEKGYIKHDGQRWVKI
ncbi:MAG: hypothetical protein E7653_06670 [Ruminococcaceae bacterium]|nr:hypothetical protein [Oscillospiraceae bacterium]